MNRSRRTLMSILRTAALAIAGVAAVVVVNAWRFRSKQIKVEPIAQVPFDETGSTENLIAGDPVQDGIARWWRRDRP